MSYRKKRSTSTITNSVTLWLVLAVALASLPSICLGQTSTSTDPSKSQKINIGEKYSINAEFVTTSTYQPVAFFHFSISHKLPKRDIVLMVNGREDYSHSPALFYSLKNEFPSLQGNDDISCGFNGHDFCVIPDSRVVEG